MSKAETSLLHRFAASGDPEALAEIVRRHTGMVYGSCLRILKDGSRASEVVQQTFLELVGSAGTVSGSVLCRLHRVATRKALEALGKDGVPRRPEYSPDKPTSVSRWEDLSPYIDQELDRVDEQTREILIRRFLQGRTMEDISSDMEMPRGVVSEKIESGVAKLSEGFGRRGIMIGAPMLGILLGRAAAGVAPASVLQELGKIAVAGAKTVSATVGPRAIESSGVMPTGVKILTAAAVLAAAACSIAVIKYVGRSSEPQKESAAEENDHLRLVRNQRILSGGESASGGQAVRPSMSGQMRPETPRIERESPGVRAEAAKERGSEANAPRLLPRGAAVGGDLVAYYVPAQVAEGRQTQQGAGTTDANTVDANAVSANIAGVSDAGVEGEAVRGEGAGMESVNGEGTGTQEPGRESAGDERMSGEQAGDEGSEGTQPARPDEGQGDQPIEP